MVASFAQSVDDDNYKNGAFKGQITNTMSMTDALRVFINSPLCTDEEKANNFLPMLKLWIGAKRGWNIAERTGDTKRASEALFQTYAILSDMSDAVFDADLRARGGYVPPSLIQVVDDDGNVTETVTIAEDGTSKTTQGGEVGVVPGAPEGYAKRTQGIEVRNPQKKKTKPRKKRKTKAKSQDIPANDTNPPPIGSEEEEEQLTKDESTSDNGDMADQGILMASLVCRTAY